jgi:acyl carrier protein
MTCFEKLNGIFRLVFRDNTIQIKPEMTANDIEGWDSFTHVNLIAAVESGFKISISVNEIMEIKDIGDLHRVIEAKLKA